MKIVDKLILSIFSIVMFCTSFIIYLLTLGWLKISSIAGLLTSVLTEKPTSNIVFGVAIVFLLLAIKAMFFGTSYKETIETGEGILLENTNGKLLVSKETLDNLAISTAKTYKFVDNVLARTTLDKEGNLIIFMSLLVNNDTNIKEMSVEMQTKIKEVIKSSLDLDVQAVNVKIKNITNTKVA